MDCSREDVLNMFIEEARQPRAGQQGNEVVPPREAAGKKLARLSSRESSLPVGYSRQ